MAARAQAGERSILLYPFPGMGHLPPMVELAKLLLRRGFSVGILLLDPPYGSTAAFLCRVSAAYPSISFHQLPGQPSTPAPTTTLQRVCLTNPSLLRHLRAAPAPLALVLDPFCLSALDVAVELRLPAYLFFPSGASSLSLFLNFPSLHSASTKSFKDLGDSPVHVPGVPPIPADHVPVPLLDRDSEFYKEFLRYARRLTELDGIVVNTFEELEPAAVRAARGGLCIPEAPSTPPIYCVGPLVAEAAVDGAGAGSCLAWLDSQPAASVVFLCFGSMGRFSAEQLREIATGLENSGHRFLWVVRGPRVYDVSSEPDLDALLPAGFLERTAARGAVVGSWAPQPAVLAHGAVGGFVTHLGWNSVLEAVAAGVPMVGWPLYAEQRMNKVVVVDGLGLAGVVGGYDEGVVSAAEVEECVWWLMESEDGEALRARAAGARAAAAAALREGGSSRAAVNELVRVLNGKRE